MSPKTFGELVKRLDDDMLLWLYEDGLFTDEFIWILKTEAYKRCLING